MAKFRIIANRTKWVGDDLHIFSEDGQHFVLEGVELNEADCRLLKDPEFYDKIQIIKIPCKTAKVLND